jgi:hypothetical protein
MPKTCRVREQGRVYCILMNVSKVMRGGKRVVVVVVVSATLKVDGEAVEVDVRQ